MISVGIDTLKGTETSACLIWRGNSFLKMVGYRTFEEGTSEDKVREIKASKYVNPISPNYNLNCL